MSAPKDPEKYKLWQSRLNAARMKRKQDPILWELWKKKISHTLTGRKIPLEIVMKTRLACLGKSHSTKGKTYEEIFGAERAAEYKKKRSETFKKVRADKEHQKRWLEIAKSKNTRNKRSISMKEYIKCHPSTVQCTIGKHEKEILDLQEQKDNCKILRQYQVLGYFVDGYCPENNVVYEVYEPWHSKTVFRDLNRKTEICNHLSCDFIILWDKIKC